MFTFSASSRHALNPLQRLGGRLALLARLLVVPVAIPPLLRWWTPDLGLPPALSGIVPPEGLSTVQRLVGTCGDIVLVGLAVATLLALARLGDRFRRGDALNDETALLQAQLGRRMLWLAGAQIAYAPLITLAVTAFNPPGQRMLAFALTGGEAVLLIGALVVFMFARLTQEAVRLADENAQIV